MLGCLLVTIVFNVPLNNRLASAEPDSPGAEALWDRYLSRWTLWNHIRTGASLAAAGLFAMAL
ncbi:MAG: anthrone oxygenase family protein [Acidobacteriota bacterium]|nr:anthrone oxygenase family protein [Acidobacteriota bacterium]